MPVPSFEDMMLPLLQVLATGQHRAKEATAKVGELLKLTPEQVSERIPSGQITLLASRVGWAKTDLVKAGLVAYPARGLWAITDRGLEVLRSNPRRIDRKYLRRFDEYAKWIDDSNVTNRKTKPDPDGPGETREGTGPPDGSTPSPTESIESVYHEFREGLLAELLSLLGTVQPDKFERIILDVMLALGYGGSRRDAAEHLGRSGGDGGVDGLISEDRLGMDQIYLQAKRWKDNVGRPTVQEFVGALAGKKARKGVIITTSDFTAEARAYASGLEQRVVLINGRKLAQLMVDHNVGVSVQQTYEIKRIDSDYFDED